MIPTDSKPLISKIDTERRWLVLFFLLTFRIFFLKFFTADSYNGWERCERERCERERCRWELGWSTSGRSRHTSRSGIELKSARGKTGAPEEKHTGLARQRYLDASAADIKTKRRCGFRVRVTHTRARARMFVVGRGTGGCEVTRSKAG